MSIQQAQQQQEVSISIEEARIELAKLATLRRFIENPDFKAVIEQMYFTDEASRLVLVKAEPNFENEKSQARVMNQINAIGQFKQFLTAKMTLGAMLEKQIQDDQETQLELDGSEE